MSNQEIERTPLTSREYFALREIFGVVSSFEKTMGLLEKRVKRVPGVWRDMKLISSVGAKVVTRILSTVTVDKIKLILKELDNTAVIVEVRRDALPTKRSDNYCYVPQEALETLIEGVVQNECLFCEKDKRASKKCPWRNAIEATYPYELPDDRKELCRFSGFSIEKG